MDEQQTTIVIEVDEYWLTEWVAYGIADMMAYLAKVSEFERRYGR